MLEFMMKKGILGLEDKENLTDDMVVVEDCGEYDEALSYYNIVFFKSKRDDMLKLYEDIQPENALHVKKIIDNKDGYKVIYSAVTRMYSTSITDFLYDYFDNDLDAIFNQFGYDSEDSQTEEYNVEQPFEEPESYNDLKESSQRNTEYDVTPVVPKQDEIPEPKQEIQKEEESTDVFSRKDVEDITAMIRDVDSEANTKLLDSLLNMYDAGEEQFVTNKLLGLLENLQEKGLIE